MAMSPRLLRPLATGFNPLSIAGLEAWWDFADVSSVTLDSGRVSAVTDKSGNGRTAANSTSGSTQPDYISGGRNGRNIARFTAASTQRLTVDNSQAAFKFLHDGTASYVAAVFSTGFVADPNGIFAIFGNNLTSTSNVGIVLQVDDRTPTFNMLLRIGIARGVGGSWGAIQENASAFVVDQTHLVDVLIDADNATASQRFLPVVDGAALSQTNISTLSASASNATANLQIGAAGNQSQPHSGDICEILIFSQQPTLSQRLALRRHLARKWGVTLA
jgi:hypothetical protein